MKAWRKHNSSSYVRKHPKQKLTRTQARTHFAAKVSEPSTLLYGLFLKVGLPTPPEFQDWFRTMLKNYMESKNQSGPAT